jgi:hypothetical protein
MTDLPLLRPSVTLDNVIHKPRRKMSKVWDKVHGVTTKKAYSDRPMKATKPIDTAFRNHGGQVSSSEHCSGTRFGPTLMYRVFMGPPLCSHPGDKNPKQAIYRPDSSMKIPCSYPADNSTNTNQGH